MTESTAVVARADFTLMYRGVKGLGEEFAGWDNEGSWPEK